MSVLTPLPDIPAHRIHPSFRQLVSDERYRPAREMLESVWAALASPDQHFIREFQTAGFDARVWELVLGAVGTSSPYQVSRPYPSPDFLFERDGMKVWIEATTANSRVGAAEDAESTIDEIEAKFHEIHNTVPIRLGSALYSKLRKKYWEQAHVVGHPLVIAIEDFADPFPVRMTDTSLVRYLYGIDHKVVSLPGEVVRIQEVKVASHKHASKEIPSAFFELPGAQHISAVIFSNEGTIPKFNRMGFNRSVHDQVRMTRVGLRTNFDPRATVPLGFGYLVGDFEERWADGMYVYHNPNARHPIPHTFFEEFSGRHWFEDGRYDNLFREFAPLSSVTAFYSTDAYAGRLPMLDARLRRDAVVKAVKLEWSTFDRTSKLAWR